MVIPMSNPIKSSWVSGIYQNLMDSYQTYCSSALANGSSRFKSCSASPLLLKTGCHRIPSAMVSTSSGTFVFHL